jgi:hypothetical protein
MQIPAPVRYKVQEKCVARTAVSDVSDMAREKVTVGAPERGFSRSTSILLLRGRGFVIRGISEPRHHRCGIAVQNCARFVASLRISLNLFLDRFLIPGSPTLHPNRQTAHRLPAA